MGLTTSPVSRSIRTLLVDDHTVVRTGLRLLIEGRAGFEVIGEADNGKDAVTIASRERPDIILLDLILGNDNGLDYIPTLSASCSTARIIVLTCLHDAELQQRAVQLGAMGLIVKEQTAEVLIKAITKVHAGEAWVDRTTMAHLISEISHPGKRNGNGSEAAQINTLTRREREIVRLVAQGLKNKQVANSLCISAITVRHHLTAIFSKLGLSDRFELIVFAHRHNLCDSWDGIQ
jgi:two-component system nitrate/nitrite response regulator NarL